jgi:hypothetical protein
VIFFVVLVSTIAQGVRELGLPREALLNLIIRGDRALPPRGSTQIQAGDHLHILVRQEAAVAFRSLVMTAAWDVSPHPNATRAEAPGDRGPQRLVPLPALATAEVSANALRVAAIRGRLQATKVSDGSWRSTRAWVDEYIASEHQR